MFASDSPTPPAAASTQVGGDPSQPRRLRRLPLPLPDPPTRAPSLYLPRQPRGGSQSERRRRHVTARSWCQGARGEPGAESRGAAARAQCERLPSRPHPCARAVVVPVPDAVRSGALDLPARPRGSGRRGAGPGFPGRCAWHRAWQSKSPRPHLALLCPALRRICLLLSLFIYFFLLEKAGRGERVQGAARAPPGLGKCIGARVEERGGGDGGPGRGIRGPGGAGARGRGSPVWSPASRARLPSVAPAHPACGRVGASQVAAGPRACSSPSHPDSGLPPPAAARPSKLGAQPPAPLARNLGAIGT